MRAEPEPFTTRTVEWWKTHGVPYEELTADEVRYRWPVINADGLNVILSEPDAGVIRARRATQTVAAAFEYPLSRIDPSTNAVAQQFTGKGGDAVRVGLGSVWLSNLEAGNVWRIDPRRVLATLPK